MDQKNLHSLKEKTVKNLNLPPEAAGVPRLELSGDQALFLEGYRDILSYAREEICVAGTRWMLRLTGRDLEITAMAPGQLRLSGRFQAIELV